MFNHAEFGKNYFQILLLGDGIELGDIKDIFWWFWSFGFRVVTKRNCIHFGFLIFGQLNQLLLSLVVIAVDNLLLLLVLESSLGDELWWRGPGWKIHLNWILEGVMEYDRVLHPNIQERTIVIVHVEIVQFEEHFESFLHLAKNSMLLIQLREIMVC